MKPITPEHFPAYFRQNEDGSYRPATTSERQLAHKEYMQTKEMARIEVDRRTPKEKYPNRVAQKIWQDKLNAWGDVNDEQGRYFQSRIDTYERLAVAWDAEQKKSEPTYRKDIRATMKEIEASSDFTNAEKITLRVASQLEPDRHGIADKIFWDRYAEVTKDIAERVSNNQITKKENELKSAFDSAQSEVDVLTATERAAKAQERAEKVQVSEVQQ